MGSGSTRAGSSISSPCSGHRMRTQSRSRRSGVPEWCGCGCRPVLRWYGTDSNPNKPFFCCPNYNSEKRWYGLFVWADTGQDEPVEKPESYGDNHEVKMNFDWRLGRLEDVRNQKLVNQLLVLVVSILIVLIVILYCKA
ncbi:hypothetical protein Ahy_B09g096054 isoform A [Arachis hypogaea]|uniref:Zinc finger GRF-type domain-containing protein n=1 Tax=Arachis hypogaea TaxID=3818 RepID=A0A444XHV2_ARAHY|nr:hypothetical protein Ahy_B09g096054 isoform A [Arachis hypogaea]